MSKTTYEMVISMEIIPETNTVNLNYNTLKDGKQKKKWSADERSVLGMCLSRVVANILDRTALKNIYKARKEVNNNGNNV